MTIVKLKKATVLASVHNKESVVTALQRFGKLHVIESKDTQQIKVDPPSDAETLIDSCRFLENSKRKIHHALDFDVANIHPIINEVQKLKETINKTQVLLDKTDDDIASLTPWGDFELLNLEGEIGRNFWFFEMPIKCLTRLEALTLPWKLISRDNTRIYIVIIAFENPVDIKGVEVQSQELHKSIKPFMTTPITLPKISLSNLKRQKNGLVLRLDELNVKRTYLTKYIDPIKRVIIERENKQRKLDVLKAVVDHGNFFQLQGWIPERAVNSLHRLSEKKGFALILESPQLDEDPPTLLHPKSMFASGSLLAKIYQLPSYRSWDPSMHLYLSFSFFFALILSDFGYAGVCAICLLMFWQKIDANTMTNTLKPLFFSMILTAGIWGLLVNSVFGYPVFDVSLTGIPIIDLNDHDLMMSLVVAIGVIHIVIANLIRLSVLITYKALWLSNLGWIFVALGAYGVWIFDLGLLRESSIILTCAGALMVFLFSYDSNTMNAASNKPLMVVQSGFLALCNITKLFSDVLSYMRLFALGLASSSLAITFNDLSVSAFSYGGVGLVGGCFIWVIGHVVNLILGIMSGVVHGLRLNFIEFYNWSQPGEGYPFVPFKIKEV